MKWYLSPHNIEFSKWQPQAIGKHLDNVSLPEKEPILVLDNAKWTLYPLDDEPQTLDEGDYVKSRTIEVDEETGIATAVYETAERPRNEVIAERRVKAKEECKRRIYASINPTAQTAMTAYAAGGLFSDKEMVLYREGLTWIKDMRSTWPELAKDRRKSIDGPQNWPKPSKALLDFVSNF